MRLTLVMLMLIAVAGCAAPNEGGAYYSNGVYVEQNGIDVFYKDGLPTQSSKE